MELKRVMILNGTKEALCRNTGRGRDLAPSRECATVRIGRLRALGAFGAFGVHDADLSGCCVASK